MLVVLDPVVDLSNSKRLRFINKHCAMVLCRFLDLQLLPEDPFFKNKLVLFYTVASDMWNFIL